MNAKYIQKTEINELYIKLVAYLKEYESDFYADVFVRHTNEYNLAILKELQTRLVKFDEFSSLT
ncbi:TPA: hypothetical protein DEG21_05095 [Patescibacteria group bacterium]|nr:hypothetical protein [Candidatus Gracilibacteria bacterium]HBY75206.1 hypothetical protein [Candidatus Gracilibacteria bacterium]